MKSNEFQYGSAEAVAFALEGQAGITQDDLHAALINAMNRIDRLERDLEETRRMASQACMAAGVNTSEE